MSKKTIALVLALFFKSLVINAETLPLEIFWQGKTALALKSAQVILDKKNNYSKLELASSYDFLADYHLDQGHYEANLNFANLLFKIKHQTSFDSAFYYARIANYYHCYINPDSSLYFSIKAQHCFKNIKKIGIDFNSIARYYSYLGNAARNTSLRSLNFLDSAILYSKNNFTKAINHRRYATFLLDELSGISNGRKIKVNFKRVYLNCIAHLKNAETLATLIFPNKKSDLHSRIYDMWSLVERINQNNALSTRLNEKARTSLIDKNEVYNFFEYAASLHLDASNKLNQYREKKGDINLVYVAEKLLQKSIPYWEGFLKEECNVCQFNERRVIDYKMPLILHFKDKNKQHYRIENLEMLCYNCYFLNIGDVFTNKQIEGFEDHVPTKENLPDWELDDYQLERLKALGLHNTPEVDDGSEFVSRL